MNEKEAELIGMHVGDGTLYRTHKSSIVWELRGSIHEQDFYAYVADLIKNLLGIELKPKLRGPNSYGIQTTNKALTKFFLDNGFSPGRKVYTVRVPDYIKKSDNLEIKRSFVRGLFDTDGCIRFDKNRTPYRYYPKIEFSFASPNLSSDLIELLRDLGFKVHFWNSRDHKSLCTAGFESLEKWTSEIKPINNKHLNRIKNGLSNKSKVVIREKSKP